MKYALLSLALGVKLIALGGLTPGCPALPPGKPKLYTDADAYEVYAAVLRSGAFTELASAQRLTIEEDTVSWGNAADNLCIHGDKSFRKKYGKLRWAFLKANYSKQRLAPLFRLDRPYNLISVREVSELFRKFGDVSDLSMRYPGSVGLLRFSAVGFDRQRTKAMVGVALSAPGLSAANGFYFLDRLASGWTVAIAKHEVCITVE